LSRAGKRRLNPFSSERKSMNIGNTQVLGLLTMLALAFTACGEGKSNGGTQASGDRLEQSPKESRPEPALQIKDIKGGTTALLFDGKFLKTLGRNEIAPMPVGRKRLKEGKITLPASSGRVRYFAPRTATPSIRGKVIHGSGGLGLLRRRAKIEVTDFKIDFSGSRIRGDIRVDGKSTADDLPFFVIDTSRLGTPRKEGGETVFEGAKVTLTDQAAALISRKLRADRLNAGTPVGSAVLRVR